MKMPDQEQCIYVVESGNSENGSYVKYSDGTMICMLKKVTTGIETSQYRSDMQIFTGYFTWTFPCAFVETPHISIGTFLFSSGDSWRNARNVNNASAQLCRL